MGYMSRYDKTSERQHLSAIQARARVLTSRFDRLAGDIPLAVLLPMIDQINTVMRQLGYLKSQLEQAAYAEMKQDDIEEVDTPGWSAKIVSDDKVSKVNNIAVAEALQEQIIKKEVRRNKRLSEQAVRSIVNTTFWNLFESLNAPKWKKTALAKRGVALEDYATVEPTAAKVRVEGK